MNEIAGVSSSASSSSSVHRVGSSGMWLLEDSMKAPSGEGSGAICAGHEELVGELEGEVEWQHSHDWRLYPEYGKGYGGTGLELCGQRDGYVRRRREEEKEEKEERGREEEMITTRKEKRARGREDESLTHVNSSIVFYLSLCCCIVVL